VLTPRATSEELEQATYHLPKLWFVFVCAVLLTSPVSGQQMGGLDHTPPPKPGGSAVPAPPRDGVTYSPDGLEAMTEAQRLFLRVHPQFWLTRVASEDSSDGNKTFEAAALHLQGGKPLGDKKPDLSANPRAISVRLMQQPRRSRGSVWSTTTWKLTRTAVLLRKSL
jgi:hypothetical protein